MPRQYIIKTIVFISIFAVAVTAPVLNPPRAGADTGTTTETEASQPDPATEALKKQIADKTDEIAKLDQEIAKYKKQIEQTGSQATSLKTAIKQLEAIKTKLSSDIKLTEKKIQVTTLNIQKLGLAINDKNENIGRGTRTLAQIISQTNEIETRSPVEVVLANQSFSDGWDNLVEMEKFQGKLNEQLNKLENLKQELEKTKTTTEKEKKNLTSLKVQITYQQKVVEQNKTEQNKLLIDTKNKESEYRKLLADRLEKKNQLEQEILDFEGRLQAIVDTSLIPKTGSGVLSYPVSPVRITQYFGNTPFATKNPQVYNGMGHNGVDFGIVTGTPIKAAADGIIVDTGNTDSACYGVSYGKWILIKHNNGLSTLYAHLSVISRSAGEAVSTGDVIGYSGNTGYTTGPHLHFTVYASQGVHISGPTEYKSKVCKSYMKLPLAPRNAYLNPMSYL